jgi:hypothetical protein
MGLKFKELNETNMKNKIWHSKLLLTYVFIFIGCSSKIKIGEYPIKKVMLDSCSGYNAISLKFRNSSYEGVFLAKDTANVKWDDLILQVNGYVRDIKWEKCKDLKIKTDGTLIKFTKAKYLHDGKEKYKGITVELEHHEW